MAKTSKGMTADAYRSVGKTYDGVTIVAPKTKSTKFTAKQLRSTIADVVGDLHVELRSDGKYAVRREASSASGAQSRTKKGGPAKRGKA